MKASQIMPFRYLKFVQFKNLFNWSPYSILGNQINYNTSFAFDKIGSFLKRNKTEVEVKDETWYKRPTIAMNNNGIRLRDEVIGAEIGTKNQFRIKKGQFLLSKIDARNGAFGVVPHECDEGIITGNFWTFDVIENKINPEFLNLITSTKKFHRFCQSASVGTTGRNYLQETLFLDISIPLPPLETQHEIVATYQQAIAEAEAAEHQAATLENNIEAYLNEALGIEVRKTERKKGLQFVRSKDLTRWDVWNERGKGMTEKYPKVKLADITIGKPQYGAGEKAQKVKSEYRYIRITDINEDGTLNENAVSACNVESKYILKDNDFLIARSGATVGKTFLYDSSFGKAIYAGYLVRYRFDLSKVHPKFVLFFTKHQYFKIWIASHQRVSAQPNINGQEFLNAPIILPPLKAQQAIVAKITELKSEIKQLKTQAAAARLQARQVFENRLFADTDTLAQQ